MILLNAGKPARAYALAHTALEELGKIPMLTGVATDVAVGLPVDWKKIDRRVRDHAEKIDMHAAADYMHSDIRADDSDVAAYQEDLARTPERFGRRNASLYVDFDGSGFVKPANAFDEADANDLLADLDRRLQYYGATLHVIADSIKGGMSDSLRKRLRTEREILRGAIDSGHGQG